MAFDDLPAQPPIYPAEAEAYADTALALSRQAAARTRCVLDVPYGDDYWQKIDIYLPDDASLTGLPVLVFAHGGAWTHGYKEWMGLMAPAIVATPAIFVSVSYRLAPANRFPVPVEDCLAALKWVHDHIAGHGGDPHRILAGGHSAGGHLYALLALRRELLEGAGLPADLIKGCLPVSSQLNLRFENPLPGSGEERIYKMFLARPGDDLAASPLAHTAGNETPFLIACGGADFPRIIKSNLEMVEALAEEPGPVEFRMIAKASHFDMALCLAEADDPWVATVRRWLRDGPPAERAEPREKAS